MAQIVHRGNKMILDFYLHHCSLRRFSCDRVLTLSNVHTQTVLVFQVTGDAVNSFPNFMKYYNTMTITCHVTSKQQKYSVLAAIYSAKKHMPKFELMNQWPNEQWINATHKWKPLMNTRTQALEQLDKISNWERSTSYRNNAHTEFYSSMIIYYNSNRVFTCEILLSDTKIHTW